MLNFVCILNEMERELILISVIVGLWEISLCPLLALHFSLPMENEMGVIYDVHNMMNVLFTSLQVFGFIFLLYYFLSYAIIFFHLTL